MKLFQFSGVFRFLFLIAAELSIIHFARHSFGFECHLDGTPFCAIARNTLLASYSLAATLILVGLFDRRAFVHLLNRTDTHPVPLLVNTAGLTALIATLPFLRSDLSPAATWALAGIWAVGVPALAGGAALMLAPWRSWKAFFRRLGPVAPLAALAGASAPFLAQRIKPLWDAETLSSATFALVERLLLLIGTPVESFPETRVIGAEGFFVNIAPSCSGIEGLALTTLFATIYLTLFRADLRFPHALLILPVALCASWLLNAVRITVLVQLGVIGFPGLAVGGFHSHAGWLMFTLLSLGIVLAAQTIPFFHKRGRNLPAPGTQSPGHVPFLSDPIVAQILPFVVFMASALLASTFAETPALAYPARAAAMGMALAIFWPYLEDLPWRLDPFAVAAGLAIAALWIVTAEPAETPAFLSQLGAGALALWILARCVGTAVFVPIIEELFFRGYLLSRLAPVGAGPARAALALLVTTAVFAALHDRWIAAAVAGVVFAALTLRSRNVTDAIVAHAVANALIAGWALATSNWAMI